MTTRKKCGLFVTALLTVAILEPQGLAAPPGRGLDLNVLAKAIARTMRTNPKLRGAWLYAQGDPRLFTFRRVLDRSRAEEQKLEMERFIRAWVPGGNYEIDERADKLYPFSELLAELQYAVDLDPQLAGCMIADGYYAPIPTDPDRLNLMLRGRVERADVILEDESQKGPSLDIERLCGRLMRSDVAWIPLEIYPSVVELAVVEPSPIQGRWFFDHGLQCFWKRDFRAAAEAFRQANLESPRQVRYYYWQILSEIAMGDTERAYERMCKVVDVCEVRPLSFAHRRVIQSLERVQGPLRIKLQELEQRALSHVSRTKRKRYEVELVQQKERL